MDVNEAVSAVQVRLTSSACSCGAGHLSHHHGNMLGFWADRSSSATLWHWTAITLRFLWSGHHAFCNLSHGILPAAQMLLAA